jgi:hypothetical protein
MVITITMKNGLSPKDGGKGEFSLTTHYDYPQPVIRKIPESIRTALDHFHLRMEPFGDSIVFREPPHTGDQAVYASCPARRLPGQVNLSNAHRARQEPRQELHPRSKSRICWIWVKPKRSRCRYSTLKLINASG